MNACTGKNPRPSTCTDVPGAVDVNVTVTIGDRVIDGEVTLAPTPDPRDDRLTAYGAAPDHWISGALLAELYAACEAATGAPPGGHPRDPQSVLAAANQWFRDALQEIERAAVEAAL